MLKLKNIPKDKMNKTEEQFAWLLEFKKNGGTIKHYGFEKVKLRLGDNCWYTPDFMVIENDDSLTLIEVKGGYIREDAIIKFKTACELFPYIKFEMWQYKNKIWEMIRKNY